VTTFDGDVARFTALEAVAGYGNDCLWLSWDTAGAHYVDIDGTACPRRGRARTQASAGLRVRLMACAPNGTPGDVRYAYLVREIPAGFPGTGVTGKLADRRPAARWPGLGTRAEAGLGRRLRQLRLPPRSRSPRTVVRKSPGRPRLVSGPAARAGQEQQIERGGNRTWDVY
jgi:hypothetical protein